MAGVCVHMCEQQRVGGCELRARGAPWALVPASRVAWVCGKSGLMSCHLSSRFLRDLNGDPGRSRYQHHRPGARVSAQLTVAAIESSHVAGRGTADTKVLQSRKTFPESRLKHDLWACFPEGLGAPGGRVALAASGTLVRG